MTIVQSVQTRPAEAPLLTGQGYVGQRIRRLEDPPLLAGVARFVDDIDLPDQLYARVVRSTVAHGRITALDIQEASRHEGVVGVFTAADLDVALRIPVRVRPGDQTDLALQPPLAQEFVRYVGEPIAVVVAEDPYIAEDAAEMVWVEIEELPVLLDARQGADHSRGESEQVLLHSALGTNVLGEVRVSYGSPLDEVFASAAVVVTQESSVHRHSAVPLETRGIVAAYDSDAGRLTIWGATKVKHWNRRALSELLGLQPESIRLIETAIGGGFGVRGELYPEDILVPWLAIRLQRTVKWVEDRAEHLVATNHSREQYCDLSIAASAEGRLLAFRATIWVDLGAYCRTHGLVLPYNTALLFPGPYDWSAFEVEAIGVLTNKTPAGTFRGPGMFEPTFHRERLLDRLAAELHLDPLELRRRNLVPRSKMPRTLDLGVPEKLAFEEEDFVEVWDRLLAKVEIDELRHQLAARRMAGELVGLGTSTFIEGSGTGFQEWAKVRQTSDGLYVIKVGVSALGQGIVTSLSQVTADALGVQIENVSVRYEDTDEVTEGGGSYASRSAVFGANAILGAVRELHANALDAASQRLGLPADELSITPRGVRYLIGGNEDELSFCELGCEGAFRFEKQRTFSMGTALASVAVDPDTGAITVERTAVGYDVGQSLNPMIVEGQIKGAAVQGISGSLYEQFSYDPQGQPLSTSFIDYSIATAMEVPDVEVSVLESTKSYSSEEALGAGDFSIRGAGEVGIIGIAAALANAVADALGTAGAPVFTHLPLSAESVRDVVETVRGSSGMLDQAEASVQSGSLKNDS